MSTEQKQNTENAVKNNPAPQALQKSNVMTPKMIGDQVITQVDNLCQGGFVMPKDYNHVNAIKAALLKLEEVVDKDKRPALEVCTPASITQALFKMCIMGLDMSLNQCYPVVRGNKLCVDPGYFGNTLRVKRLYPDWHPVPRVVRKGDKFKFETDIESGATVLVQHETSLENLDADFVAAYMYIPLPNGKKDLFIMTKKQITSAWAKSSSFKQTVHKEFEEKMIKKTMINSASTLIMNATPTYHSEVLDQIEQKEIVDIDYTEVVEVKEPEKISSINAVKEEAVKDWAEPVNENF